MEVPQIVVDTGVGQLNLQAQTPQEFLQQIGALP
jgi:hypothetical protein